MIPRTHICATLLLLWAATGCTEPAEYASEVRIEAFAPGSTRTSMTGSKASFTAGDNIGVFETLTGRANVSHTFNGTSWSPSSPMYWYNGSADHTFYAYYPYTASASGLRAGIPALSTQTISTSPQPAMDLLVSGPQTTKRTPSVSLSFTHAFALIQLNIKMGILQILNPFYLNRITIQGGNSSGSNRYGIVNITGAPSQVGYDLSANALWAATNNAQSYAQSFYSDITGVTLLTTSISFYAFVLPGTYTNPAPGVSFRITTLGILRTTSFANLSQTTFQAGTKYVYDVSIGLLTRSASPEIEITPHPPVPLDDRFTE